MKKLFIISVISIFMVSALYTYAGPWERNIGPDYSGTAPLSSKLNLTEEQSSKLKMIHEAFLRDIEPLRDQIFSMRAELRLLWEQTDPDRDQILAKEKALDTLQSQIREKTTLYRFEMRDILSDEQKIKMSVLGEMRHKLIERVWRHDHKIIRGR